MDDNSLPEIARDAFTSSLQDFIGSADTAGKHVGLVLVDIVNLMRINHQHGFVVGDELLSTAHAALISVSKLPQTVFRISGHHFAFILPDLSSPAFIALGVNRIQRLLEEELVSSDELIPAQVCIGVAVNQERAGLAMDMLSMAERSLIQMKGNGELQLEHIMSDTLESDEEFKLEVRFAEALYSNEMELFFQPKINLHSGKADRAEALLRWNMPGRGYINPEQLVSLADDAGSAFDLTKWVVHAAVRQQKAWQDELDVDLAFNLSAPMVNHPDIVNTLNDAVRIWGADPERLTVEITENAIIQDKEAGRDNLLKIRELGIKLSIDDFGTGYSSLSYFKHIPAQELKIDKSFVGGLLDDEQNLELVKIIIRIAREFGLNVVAEGIEDRAALDLLKSLGCDYGQGYLFSKPLPKEEFKLWIKNWPGLPA